MARNLHDMLDEFAGFSDYEVEELPVDLLIGSSLESEIERSWVAAGPPSPIMVLDQLSHHHPSPPHSPIQLHNTAHQASQTKITQFLQQNPLSPLDDEEQHSTEEEPATEEEHSTEEEYSTEEEHLSKEKQATKDGSQVFHPMAPIRRRSRTSLQH